jgi:hypothetical protein
MRVQLVREGVGEACLVAQEVGALALVVEGQDEVAVHAAVVAERRVLEVLPAPHVDRARGGPLLALRERPRPPGPLPRRRRRRRLGPPLPARRVVVAPVVLVAQQLERGDDLEEPAVHLVALARVLVRVRLPRLGAVGVAHLAQRRARADAQDLVGRPAQLDGLGLARRRRATDDERAAKGGDGGGPCHRRGADAYAATTRTRRARAADAACRCGEFVCVGLPAARRNVEKLQVNIAVQYGSIGRYIFHPLAPLERAELRRHVNR